MIDGRPKVRIDPATRIGGVHLTVADLDRQLTFYRDVLGLKLHRRENATAALGAGGEDLLKLTEVRGVRRVPRTSGLYHFAVLLPDRRELARVMARLFTLRYPNAPTDHVMTQTTYLDDPEGNGIEIYADTPEEGEWLFSASGFSVRRANGAMSDGREPLDVEALFKTLGPNDRLDAPMPEGTKMGHVHLHVADLTAAVHFYHDVLGFDIKGSAPAMGAAFLSAGGYHHHIGLNTWAGKGVPPPPPDSQGLRYFTVILPNRVELDIITERVRQEGIATEEIKEGVLVRDPSKNGVLLAVRSSAEGVPPEVERHTLTA